MSRLPFQPSATRILLLRARRGFLRGGCSKLLLPCGEKLLRQRQRPTLLLLKKVDFNGRMRLRRAGNRSDLARTVRKALVLVDADLSEGRPRIASPAFSNRRYAQNWISAVNGACSRVIAPSWRCSMEEREHFDWRGVNLGAIPFLAVVGAVIVLLAMWRRPMSLRGT